jgi:hypothetical protein
MSVTRFIGKKLPVDYRFLNDFRVNFSEEKNRQSLTASGSIMESAKVFEKLEIIRRDNTIFIKVFASLPFWKRQKTPDFNEIKEMNLSPGTYDIHYIGSGKQSTFIKKINVGN